MFKVVVDVTKCQDNMFVTNFDKIKEFWILSKGGSRCLMPFFLLVYVLSSCKTIRITLIYIYIYIIIMVSIIIIVQLNKEEREKDQT